MRFSILLYYYKLQWYLYHKKFFKLNVLKCESYFDIRNKLKTRNNFKIIRIQITCWIKIQFWLKKRKSRREGQFWKIEDLKINKKNKISKLIPEDPTKIFLKIFIKQNHKNKIYN